MAKIIVEPQKTDSHCGPAVLKALLAVNQVAVSQDDVVNAARVRSSILRHGMRPYQIAKAVAKLAPDLKLWCKEGASGKDLSILINVFRLPVVVEWQGLFYKTPEAEKRMESQSDRGHYAIVTDIDVKKDLITIDDPYPDFNKNLRNFSYKWFLSRWWDNDIIKKRGKKDVVKINSRKLLFVVVPKDVKFPGSMRMRTAMKLKLAEKKAKNQLDK